jgi:tetratricopeptide (TPR) repeat protein
MAGLPQAADGAPVPDNAEIAALLREIAQLLKLEGSDRFRQQAYARAAELDPKNLEALKSAAKCYLKAGQYTKSLMYCESAQKVDENSTEVMSMLACAYEAQKGYEQAIGVYRRWLALAGDEPNVLLPLGVTYMKAGQYDRAREALISVSQKRPENGAVFRDLGYCLIKLGDSISAVGPGNAAGPAFTISVDGNDITVQAGELKVVPLGLGEKRTITIRPGKGWNVGAGKNRAQENVTVEGGVVGLVLDGRGRPIALPSGDAERTAKLNEWLRAMNLPTV